jgi:RNA polymerase sigma-70 factor (ECF subfamily)
VDDGSNYQGDWLTRQFESHRGHLRAVAYRMLGSGMEADDAVQEAWLRVSRADSSAVENLGGWLTTIVARVCLNMLQARTSRREDLIVDNLTDPVAGPQDGGDPEHEAIQADSVGAALLVVLETLTPAERLAFVLHDMFAVPFEEIAPIVRRSPAAARQLASRARRRVQGAEPGPDADATRQREIVGAFLAASRGGDFDTLVALLDPDAVVRSDAAAVNMGTPDSEIRGATAVAQFFSGRAKSARLALIDGSAGAVWTLRGRPQVVFDFTVADGKIVTIAFLADPDYLDRLDLEFLRS